MSFDYFDHKKFDFCYQGPIGNRRTLVVVDIVVLEPKSTFQGPSIPVMVVGPKFERALRILIRTRKYSAL